MAIELDIQKNFKGFSLDVRLKGQDGPIGILGASGSGKSMTLRSIAGIETPDSGRIIINGKTVFLILRQKINLKPRGEKSWIPVSELCPFPNYDCGKEYCLRVSRGKKRAFTEGCRLHKKISFGGTGKAFAVAAFWRQQQRVALARMMIGEPEVILLDEPFSALDGYLKDILQRDMQNF